MATNKAHELAIQLQWNVGTGVTSGSPVIMGSVVGVTLADADSNGYAPVDMSGSYNLSVTGTNSGGNVAVNCGDALYAAGSNGSVALTKNTGGTLFGYAYSPTVAPGSQLIASGATATIEVILVKP